MKRVAILLATQLALVAAYFAVEKARAPEPPFVVERIDAPAPALRVDSRSGPVDLASFRGRPVLVHFWATWCVPCREELPGLVDAAREEGVPLLAITDEPWETVSAFFGDSDIPDVIVRDGVGDAARRFSVSGLPDTFVIEGGDRVVARMGGARDWSTRRARDYLAALAGE